MQNRSHRARKVCCSQSGRVPYLITTEGFHLGFSPFLWGFSFRELAERELLWSRGVDDSISFSLTEQASEVRSLDQNGMITLPEGNALTLFCGDRDA